MMNHRNIYQLFIQTASNKNLLALLKLQEFRPGVIAHRLSVLRSLFWFLYLWVVSTQGSCNNKPTDNWNSSLFVLINKQEWRFCSVKILYVILIWCTASRNLRSMLPVFLFSKLQTIADALWVQPAYMLSRHGLAEAWCWFPSSI